MIFPFLLAALPSLFSAAGATAAGTAAAAAPAIAGTAAAALPATAAAAAPAAASAAIPASLAALPSHIFGGGAAGAAGSMLPQAAQGIGQAATQGAAQAASAPQTGLMGLLGQAKDQITNKESGMRQGLGLLGEATKMAGGGQQPPLAAPPPPQQMPPSKRPFVDPQETQNIAALRMKGRQNNPLAYLMQGR